MQDGGVISVTGFPRVSGKRGGPSKQRLDHGANMGISYNTSHAYVPRASFRRLYLPKLHLRRGSSSAKEVGVLAIAVVVHVYRCTSFCRCSCHRCRGTWGLRTFWSRYCDGTRSRSFGEVLDDSNVFGVTVVVHTTSGYLSVRSWRRRCTRCQGTCHIIGCSCT